MKQHQFEEQFSAEWDDFERGLNQTVGLPRGDQSAGLDFAHRYRRICQHLALARSRGYSIGLQHRLNQLVLAGQHDLYPDSVPIYSRIRLYFTRTFPRAVRQTWRWIAFSALLFLSALVMTGVAVYRNPTLVYSVLSYETVREFEQMYSGTPQKRGASARSADDDVLMFGYYLRHNTGIGFRLYGGSVLAGVGTLLALLWNGAHFGALGGYLTQAGYARNLFGFVVGHSALELTAIVLGGAAGFQLGFALLFPGRQPRLERFRRVARESLDLVYGMATLFFLAAAVEAFWSPRDDVSFVVKLACGALLWMILLSYFFWAGRDRDSD